MQIGELSKRSGLSIDTLRYYEKIGLIVSPPRNASGWRDYNQDILRWLEFLGKMKAAGMTINEMIKYADLKRQGEGTFVQRREMLEERHKHVKSELEKLETVYSVLNDKIALYRKLESENG